MARGNPYAFDPNLMAGFSNLTRALIGSAADDAALARARASDAAANASNARAGLYGAQTTGRNQQNEMEAALYAAGNALAGNPEFQSQILSAMGIDTLGADFVGPPAPGQMRLGTDMANAAARTALGTYGNANVMTNAMNNIGEGADSSLARSMILDGSNDEAARGALLLAPQGGQYQNPGFAGEQLLAQTTTDRLDDQLDYQADVYNYDSRSGDNRYETDTRFGPGGQADRDTAAAQETLRREDDLQYGPGGQGDRNAAVEERWQNYRSDRNLEGEQYDADQRTALAEWQHENRDIEIAVEPGKRIVVNPAAGQLLGVSPNEQGLYILDGGPKPGAIRVEVGQQDVYLTREDAEALGITPNDRGQYMIPGRPNPESPTPSTNTQIDVDRFNNAFEEDLANYGDDENPLPRSASIGLRNIALQMTQTMARDPNVSQADAYSEVARTVISPRNFKFDMPGLGTGDTTIPGYIHQQFMGLSDEDFTRRIQAGANGGRSSFMTLMTQTLGYSEEEAVAYARQLNTLRANR